MNVEFASKNLEMALSRETAAGHGLRAWGNLYSALPNPDPVLRKTGQSISILDEIRREVHVTSCAESREAAVTKKKWAVERLNAKPGTTETIEAAFKELPIRQIVREMCEAWGYGYQVSEIVWRRNGGLLLPERIYSLPREWFVFGKDGALRLRSSPGDMTGTPVEPYKFLLTQHRASYDNPYGEAKYSSCFWPVTFKKGGLKFWAIFVEKFGMPHVIGKLPRSVADTERDSLMDKLIQMVQNAVAVIPDDGSVEFLLSNVTGSSDTYERFAAYHDAQISTAILGHSAGATSTPGKLGGEDLAVQVRADLIESDAGMVEETMNTLIRYIHELNPSLGDNRPQFLLYDPKDIDKPRAERDALLLGTNRVKFTKKYFVEKYDFAEDEIEVVEPGVTTAPEFSATLPGGGGWLPQTASFSTFTTPNTTGGYQAAVDALATGLPDDAIQTQVEGLLKPVLDAVNNAESFDDVQAGLDGAYGKMDDSDVQNTLEKLELIGEAWGKASRQPTPEGAK